MKTRLKVVGVISALLLGVAVPAAIAQDDDAPVWSKCDARGRCVFQVPSGLPVLDEARVDELNDVAAELAAFLEEAGIEHDVLTLDVVTWDRSDPEANRAVARFWARVTPGVPPGFVPWPVPDEWRDDHGVLEFEGVWPDDLLPYLEEWLGEDLPFFEEMPWPRRLGERWRFEWLPEPEPSEQDPETPFQDRPLDPEFGDLGAILEEFLGGEGAGDLRSLFEEFFAGRDPAGLGEVFGGLGDAGPIGWLDETMAELAEYLDERGIDTVTIEGPMGVGWVVWDFFDEDAAAVVEGFFADRWAAESAQAPWSGEGPVTGELPEWGWPFDGGDG